MGFVTSALLGGQTTTATKEKVGENKMAEIQKQVETVLVTKGSHWLEISSSKNEDFFMQFVREEEDGKTGFEVVMAYPFSESWETTLRRAGVAVPVAWKQTAFSKGEEGELEFAVTGTDAKTVTAFVQEVFAKLFKAVPDTLKRTDNKK